MDDFSLTYRLIGLALILLALVAGFILGAQVFSNGANLMCVFGMIALGLTWVIAGTEKGRS